MVGAFGPGAVWGVLPQPDGSLLHITTSHGNTEITAAGGLLPPGRTSKLAARPDYLIPATAAGKTASRIGAAHLPAMPQGASASSATAIVVLRSEEHTSELQSLMRISYAVFCLKKKKKKRKHSSRNH